MITVTYSIWFQIKIHIKDGEKYKTSVTKKINTLFE